MNEENPKTSIAPHTVVIDLREINSFAQESSGLKRSITTAALLSFILPVAILLITTYWPYKKWQVESSIIEQGTGKFLLAVTNLSSEPIDSLVVDIDYGQSEFEGLERQDRLEGTALLPIGSNDGRPASELPKYADLLIHNLPPRDPVSAIVSVKNPGTLKLKGVIREGAVLVDGFLSSVLANLHYWVLYVLAVALLARVVFLYWVAVRAATKLERCLVPVGFAMHDPAHQQKWVGRSLDDFFEFVKTLRSHHPHAPSQLESFEEFTRQHNMLLQNHQYVCFAPFDVLGSPTVAKLFTIPGNSALCLALDENGDVTGFEMKQLNPKSWEST